ncbi:VOC family protein [Fusibacter ferrireducens]|uniref:VOC family protein n=1 Tax=Fusibacter ferrireducens TaxID=2785058 RepID=A0ABR9ZMG7_9FIRM|nr:VOC family protein [Fusibacter ferrireducens]MBF4691631.1 VOC family protein [Fusibacter ferrireducens]
MNVRFARHAKALEPLLHFYCNLLGLKVISEFKDHNGYTGVILSCDHCNWEIEFTISSNCPNHKADEDDLIVFKYDDKVQYGLVLERLRKEKYLEFAPKNPFWEDNGKLFRDPEGYGIVITLM